MRRDKLLLIISLFTISSCGFLMKKAVGIKNPKVESNESISQYAQKSKIGLGNQFVLKVDTASDKQLLEIDENFNFGTEEIMLYNAKTGVRYCYVGNSNCLGDHSYSIRDSFKYHFKVCPDSSQRFDQSLQTLLERMEHLDGSSVSISDLPKADYYLIWSWSKYLGRKKYKLNDLKWMEELVKDSPYQIAILKVNIDLNQSWGLPKNGKIRMKMKLVDGGFESTNSAYPIQP